MEERDDIKNAITKAIKCMWEIHAEFNEIHFINIEINEEIIPAINEMVEICAINLKRIKFSYCFFPECSSELDFSRAIFLSKVTFHNTWINTFMLSIIGKNIVNTCEKVIINDFNLVCYATKIYGNWKLENNQEKKRDKEQEARHLRLRSMLLIK